MLSKIKRVLRQIVCGRKILMPINIPIYKSNLLAGRRAFVTGGTGGIGRAIAIAFVRSGARVCISGRNQKRVDSIITEIKREIGEEQAENSIFGIELDNTKDQLFDSAITHVNELLGGLDVLVNNAGLVKGRRFGEAESSEYDEIMAANLKGAFFLSQCVAGKWKINETKGNILNVCSASSLRPGNSAYILSKWGLRSMTLGLAKELIPYGIVVNGIAPGATATEHFAGKMENGIAYPSNPAGRMATVEEIANLAVILVSPLARMVVGDILYASGGAGVITFDDV